MPVWLRQEIQDVSREAGRRVVPAQATGSLCKIAEVTCYAHSFMSRSRIALVSAATAAIVVAGGIGLAAVISGRESEPGSDQLRRSRVPSADARTDQHHDAAPGTD